MTPEEFDQEIAAAAEGIANAAEAIMERRNVPYGEALGIIATSCERTQHALARMEAEDGRNP